LNTSAALAISHLSFAYPGTSSPALTDISLKVNAGERLGVLGPNGGGKSTLLKLVLGLLPAPKDTIEVLGTTPQQAQREGLVGYVAQKQEAELRFPLSGRQVAGLGVALRTPWWKGIASDQRKAVDDAIDLVGASSFVDKPIGEMSGGQVQRVMIARALATKPSLLLLDEPTVGIDPAGQQQFAAFLTSLVRQLRLTVVLVSHDLRTIAAGCDRVACLSRTLHAHTSPAGLTPQVLAEVFRHDVAAIFGDLHVHAHKPEDCDVAPQGVPLTVRGKPEGEA
jgi:zinc transport system ATP-binding protein